MIVFSYILKVAGGILILFGGIKLGNEYKHKLKARTALLRGVKDGLAYLEGQIVMGEEMLEIGARECGKRFFADCNGKDLFTLFADKLAHGDAASDTCWNEALDCVRDEFGIMQNEEYDVLNGLAGTLGTADTEHHSSHLLDTAQKIDAICTAAEDKLKRDGGLAVKLSCALSAVLILLLW